MAPPQIVNREQSAAWNGPEGAHWAEVSERRVAHADLDAPLLDAVRIERADAVLDVGCGIGEMTLDAARRAADGSATGIDLSELMIDRARISAAAAHVDNASFFAGDAQVHHFVPGAFDVVVSHFGSMFFGDPVAAFKNLATALRPGGRLALVCPQAMDRCTWYVEPLAGLLDAHPTQHSAPSAMFSLARPDRGRADAARSRLRVGPVPIRRHIVVVRRRRRRRGRLLPRQRTSALDTRARPRPDHRQRTAKGSNESSSGSPTPAVSGSPARTGS